VTTRKRAKSADGEVCVAIMDDPSRRQYMLCYNRKFVDCAMHPRAIQPSHSRVGP
jgi:hypothetical protein